MALSDARILLKHGFVELPGPARAPIDAAAFATLLTNVTHYGFALSRAGTEALRQIGAEDAERWWGTLEPALRAETGADREMGDHVVYKNFPTEVLAMDEADYWVRQVLMYWGLPNDLFTQLAQPREALDEPLKLRVLQPAREETLGAIYADLVGAPVRWGDPEWAVVEALAARFTERTPPTVAPFKENLVRLAVRLRDEGIPVSVKNGTDVLRLALALSGAEPDLREPAKLRTFKRKERRWLLGMLESAAHLEADVARRPERFKRLLHALHPGDWAARFPRVVAAYDKLYRDDFEPTFESTMEALLRAKDPAVLKLLKDRPGLFARRLHQCLLLFGGDAAGAFEQVHGELTTGQLVTLRRYLETVGDRETRTFPPRGNWQLMQVVPNPPERAIPAPVRDSLVAALSRTIGHRVTAAVGPVRLDPETERVRLPDNDAELLPFGRGTRFPIPDEVTFLRSASYWSTGPTVGNIWYDNGWNFFEDEWVPRGACCWTAVTALGDGAVFSGDPTNSKDAQGRACQLIDLTPDILRKQGIRYAVWSVLCYSRKPFDEAQVFAALQWGAEPAKGALFEPARAQLAFPLTGQTLTKYVAMVDLKANELVYLDANLRSSVHSAEGNDLRLVERLPAFLEALDARPTVHDLFRDAPRADDGTPVVLTDADRSVSGKAWVFDPVNDESEHEPLELSAILAAKG